MFCCYSFANTPFWNNDCQKHRLCPLQHLPSIHRCSSGIAEGSRLCGGLPRDHQHPHKRERKTPTSGSTSSPSLSSKPKFANTSLYGTTFSGGTRTAEAAEPLKGTKAVANTGRACVGRSYTRAAEASRTTRRCNVARRLATKASQTSHETIRYPVVCGYIAI